MKAIVSANGRMAQVFLQTNEVTAFNEIVCKPIGGILPLTTPQEPGATIEVKEVWQYQHRGSNEWLTCEKTDFKTFEEYSSYMFNSWDCATRIALEPTHPLDGYNIDKDNRTPYEEYLDTVIEIRQESGLYEEDCVTLKNPPQSEKWVSVQDRLPNEQEAKEDLLVLDDGLRMTAEFIKGEWWFDWTNEFLKNVTHWMPLPELPATV